MEQKWLKEVQALLELKREKGSSSPVFKRRVERLNHEIFRELCEKSYKDECDPAYCTPRYTDTCRYLKVWREVKKRIGLSDN